MDTIKNKGSAFSAQRYLISIIPVDEESNATVKIYFTSQQVKDDYVSQEYKYTVKEYLAYMGAPKFERNLKKSDLNKKRLDFAKKMGYVPSSINPMVWRKL